MLGWSRKSGLAASGLRREEKIGSGGDEDVEEEVVEEVEEAWVESGEARFSWTSRAKEMISRKNRRRRSRVQSEIGAWARLAGGGKLWLAGARL